MSTTQEMIVENTAIPPVVAEPEVVATPVIVDETIVEPPASKKTKRAAKRRAARRQTIDGLSRPAMHRIKRAANVERLDAEAVEATRAITHDFLKKVLADTVSIAKHQKRKTIRAEDVQEAVEMQPQGIFPAFAPL